jgi:hypothetical protein
MATVKAINESCCAIAGCSSCHNIGIYTLLYLHNTVVNISNLYVVFFFKQLYI